MSGEKSKKQITKNRLNKKGYTVRELRSLAKERGLKRYSKLRKDELIELIHQSKSRFHDSTHVENAHILDEPVVDDTPSLQPNPSTKPKLKHRLKQRLNALGEKIQSELNTFADSVVNFIPPAVKEEVSNIKTKVNNIFQTVYKNVNFRESKPKHKVRKALKGIVEQYTIDGVAFYDPKLFLEEVRFTVINLLTENRQVKVYFVLSCIMERIDMKSGDVVSVEAHFSSKNATNLDSTDVDVLYNNGVDKMLESMTMFQQQGSNWRFKSVIRLDINTMPYKPLKGKSYIPLPPFLAAKKAIINMQNDDDECFKWCVTRALNAVDDHPERITETLKLQANELDWKGIEFPVAADANVIGMFERNNNVQINLFGYETNVYPIYVSTWMSPRVVDLLLISDGNTKHYCWIKNFNKLLALRSEKSHNSMRYCKRCLQGYRTVESLNRHNECCLQHGAQRIELPKPDTKTKFQNYNRSMRVPFVIYADFESFIKPISTCQPDPRKSYTNKYQKHKPCSFSYKIVCSGNKKYSRGTYYTAEDESDDVAQIFIDRLEEDLKERYERFKFPEDMIFTEDDEKLFDETTLCHICNKDLGEDRVRDHCHISGKFRGAVHNSCNINYKVPKFFPVYFHNLSGYDGHLLIKKLRGNNNEKITCIPNNEEKYISFSREVIVDKYTNKQGKQVIVKRELRFIDSFRFMPSSLDALTKNLSKDQFIHLRNFGKRYLKKINNYSESHLDLLLRKGVYPYDYVDSIEKLNESRLPPKSAFYSKLNDTEISDEDYIHAQTVWKEFNCETMRDYLDLYNICDVAQLADIFENFRDLCMKHYKLDPAWCYTSPGLSWDAMLKMTGIELELLSDYDMILMIKNGIRGGVSTITTRYGKSNNKYMGEMFDENKPSTFITYLDANNLYGWAMSKPLPVSEFSWMTEDELNNWNTFGRRFDVTKYIDSLPLNELRSLAYYVGLTDVENYSIGMLRMKVEEIVICKEIDLETYIKDHANGAEEIVNDVSAYLKSLTLDELKLVADKLDMTGYDKLSVKGMIMFIEDVLECHNIQLTKLSEGIKPQDMHNNKYGCILEVDLEYPKELHDAHNEYPLAPESVKVGTVHKLIPNLHNKKKYVVHYENLKMYENMGLKITKIHRGIKFNERPWLKQYIDLNTELRTKATNDFEKDFFKLMNNSVFGKTMENIENHVDIRLVCDEDEAIKLAAKTNYDRFTIFDENLIAVHMKRTKLVYNKPIYLGMCILDLSKTLMYDFHYNYMKHKFGDKAKLMFTDTDSLAYEIQTDDFYKDINNDIEARFDTSEYPADHPSGIKTGINKKVLGMFKDEAAGKQIEEFVGLKAKSYSYKMLEGNEHKKCKGIKKNVVKSKITHDDYKECLFNKTTVYRSMNVIRSYKHDMYTEELNKIALSADDDKRVIMGDCIHTLALGHYKLDV